MQSPRFRNCVVVITGAANGVGAATAKKIALEGGHVILLDIDQAGLQTNTQIINENNGSAVAVVCDISQESALDEAIESILRRFGKIDALINNAAVHRYDHFLDLEMNDFDYLMNTNVRGTILVTQKCLPHIIDAQGSVVNIASTAALGNHAYSTAYAASGGAIIAFTKALTNEYGKEGVNFNVVCLGAVTTQMWSESFNELPSDFEPRLLVKSAPFTPKVQTPEEAAGLISFLASPEGRQLNGSVITADGGSMA